MKMYGYWLKKYAFSVKITHGNILAIFPHEHTKTTLILETGSNLMQ